MSDYDQLQQLAAHRQQVMATTPQDDLLFLWESTAGFFARFGLVPTVNSQFPVLIEEMAEVGKALDIPESDEALAGEATDVLVVLLSIVQARGIALSDLRNALHATIHKNDSKTFATHYVDRYTGKITRKP